MDIINENGLNCCICTRSTTHDIRRSQLEQGRDVQSKETQTADMFWGGNIVDYYTDRRDHDG